MYGTVPKYGTGTYRNNVNMSQKDALFQGYFKLSYRY